LKTERIVFKPRGAKLFALHLSPGKWQLTLPSV